MTLPWNILKRTIFQDLKVYRLTVYLKSLKIKKIRGKREVKGGIETEMGNFQKFLPKAN